VFLDTNPNSIEAGDNCESRIYQAIADLFVPPIIHKLGLALAHRSQICSKPTFFAISEQTILMNFDKSERRWSQIRKIASCAELRLAGLKTPLSTAAGIT
jgi:hypothetical protein